MSQFCFACCAPLFMPEMKGPVEDYCRHCVDESGKLKSRDEVKASVAMWLKSWQTNLDDDQALARADHFLKAMPAWAD